MLEIELEAFKLFSLYFSKASSYCYDSAIKAFISKLFTFKFYV